MKTVFIQIGNSDNKLTQDRWSSLCGDIDEVLYLGNVHGKFYSLPNSIYQNACYCLELTDEAYLKMILLLQKICRAYSQDSIAVSIANDTHFIRPVKVDRRYCQECHGSGVRRMKGPLGPSGEDGGEMTFGCDQCIVIGG